MDRDQTSEARDPVKAATPPHRHGLLFVAWMVLMALGFIVSASYSEAPGQRTAQNQPEQQVVPAIEVD